MTNKIILGIDISKHFADMCAISETGEVLLESKIHFDLAGLQHFAEQLRVLSKGKIDASKWSKPFLQRVSYCRYFCMVYISTMLLEIGVPVAKITPLAPVSSSK